MASTNVNLTFTFTPVFDVKAFNNVLTTIKSSLGSMGGDIKLIDASKYNASLSSIQQETRKATDALKHMGVQTETTAKSGGILQRAFAFNQIAQSMQMVAGATAPFVNSFIELDKQVKNIGTLGRENFEEFAALATELSVRVPDDAATIAEGVYQAISASIAGTNQELMGFVEVASKVGVAGLSDTKSAVDGLSSVINAYGLSANDASKVADTFFAGIKLGKTSFVELNSSIASFVPMASALGVGFDQGTAAIARLTAMGTPTSQAATQMNAVFTLLQKGTSPLNKALEESGTSLEELREKLQQNVEDGGGLVNVMKVIVDAAKKSDSTVASLTGRVEAAKIIESLAGTQDKFNASLETYRGVVREIEGGAAEQAFDVASKSIHSQIAGIMSSVGAMFNNAFMALGDSASIALGVVNQLGPSLMGFAALGTIIPPGLTSSISNMATTLLTKLVPSLAVTTVAQTATTAATTASGTAATATSISFKALWSSVLGPVALVVAGVAAVGLALYLLYENVEPVRKAMDYVWEIIKTGAEGAWAVISKGFEILYAIGTAVFNYVTLPIQVVVGVVSSIIDSFSSMNSSAGSSIDVLGMLKDGFQVVIDVFNVGLAIIEGVNATITGFIESMVGGITSLLKLDFSAAWDSFTGAGETAKKNFDAGFNKAMDEASIEKMKSQLADSLKEGVEISVKLNEAKSAEQMANDLADFEKQIQPLQLKVDAGTATDEEKKQLDDLQKKATEVSKSLRDTAPEAVQGIKMWIDSQGNLHQKYEISTQKVKEVANAQKEIYGDELKAKQKEHSDELIKGLADYDKTKAKLAEVQEEMSKTNDPTELRRLGKEYNDHREILMENHEQLLKGFEEGAEAGLLTAEATLKIEKSLDLVTAAGQRVREQYIDNMVEVLEADYGDGVMIQAKLDKVRSVANLTANLTEIEQEINAIQLKVDAGTASDEEKKKLDGLYQKAKETSEQLRDVAPEAVQGIVQWTDSQGKLHSYYDISVEKAREVAESQDGMYSGQLKEQQDKFAANFKEGLTEYDEAKRKLAELRLQIERTNDPDKVKEYTKEYNRQIDVVNRHQGELVNWFEKAAKQGLLTGKAAEEIEKKMGYAKGTAQKLKEEMDRQKAQADKVANAVKGIGEQFTEAQKKLKEDYDKALNTVIALRLEQEKGKNLTAAQKKELQEATAVLQENSSELLQADKIRKQTAAQYKTTFEEEKKNNQETKTSTMLQYEMMKKLAEMDIKALEVSVKRKAMEEGRKLDKMDELAIEEKKYENLNKETVALDDIIKKYKIQKDEMGKLTGGVGIKKEDFDKLQDEVLNNLKNIQNSEEVQRGLQIEIVSNAVQEAQEIAKFTKELEIARESIKKEQLEYNFKIGVLRESKYIEEAIALQRNEVVRGLQEIAELESKISSENDQAKKLQLIKQLEEQKAVIERKQNDIIEKEKELYSVSYRERIEDIKDLALREKEIHIFEAQKKYEAEVKAAKGNNGLILQAFIELQNEKHKAEQEYLLKSSGAAVQSVKMFAESLSGAIDGVLDASRNKNANDDTLKSLEKDEDDLKKSLANREIDFREYQTRMSELEEKRKEASRQSDTDFWALSSKALSTALQQTADKQMEALQDLLEQKRILKESELSMEMKIEETKRKIVAETNAGNLEAAIQHQESLAQLEKQRAQIIEATAELEKGQMERKISAYATMFAALGTQQKNWGKAALLTALKVLKTELPLAIAGSLFKNVSQMGVWGIAAQAGVTAILYAALSLAESAVAGFRKGGLVTGNQRTVQVNEEGQEFILNARATALNLRDLTTINQKNYSIEEYVLKERPDIKQKLIAEALLRDKRHIRIQTEMFQNLVANERYEKEMAKNDNKDLLNEIKEMKKTLEIQNEEIKYLTKITERGKFKLMLEADSDSIFKKAEIKRQSRAYRT